MSTLRRFVTVLLLPPALALLAASPAAADDAPGGDQNTAVAVNTEDGASVFRLAFSVRNVANGVVDQTNSAYALASCTDCQTVALALQVVLVNGDADVAVPVNRAVAYNEQCVDCLTYASATQIVLGYDGPVRFTAAGRQRLHALRQTLLDLEGRVGELTAAQLHAEVSAAKAELVAILEEELVEVPAGTGDRTADDRPDGSEPTTTASTTAPSSATPTTAVPSSTTTSTATSSSTSSSSTTSTAPSTSITTTGATTATADS